ncbi:MAG: TIGR03619 family F420-dependent LLM class oxidoreductase [Gammaproteobacteria bacterium]|jgi:probable F420-dependent oxidoreductase|nr:TIGR03619 family F420-dependent LLM class oxidoreductase [Gammaproteobacteria bacterium]MBT4493247.1 TIGR03619 family F420-dependent LLM class oxidoreductase [Gammaproteobacteria bacterium]
MTAMKIGISIRVMGSQSTPEIIQSILESADQAGIESAWIVDHIAIPPDDSEGSEGRYLDPLSTLAWMAGRTKSIKVGTSVLVLPYRPALPTAKTLATIQELSGGRLLLGVGIGWMDPEFKALGIDRRQRGQISDETLRFIHKCFDNDVVETNNQPFLFRPRPERPPIYVGGSAPHAQERALKYGDGWLPMGRLEKLQPAIAEFKNRASEVGHPGEVVTFMPLEEGDLEVSKDRLLAYREAGVTRVIVGRAYEKAEDWLPAIDMIQELTSWGASTWN